MSIAVRLPEHMFPAFAVSGSSNCTKHEGNDKEIFLPMNENKTTRTGIPSIDRPWMQYYPPALIENLHIPEQTIGEYLREHCPGEDVVAIHYYGNDITWKQLFEQADLTARGLKALGLGEGDAIPTFLRAVPEFIYLLLAAEKIGASVLCRDNTLEENVEAVRRSGANVIFAQDYLSQRELNAYRHGSEAQIAVLLSPYRSAKYAAMPEHIQKYIDEQYPDKPAYGGRTMSWDWVLEMGKNYTGEVEAPRCCCCSDGTAATGIQQAADSGSVLRTGRCRP